MQTKQALIDELENLAATPRGIGLEVYLPNVSDDGIWKLGRWAEKINDSAPALSEWLHACAVEEIYRRGESSPIVARTPRIPTDWTNSQLADALLASYSMMRANQLRDLDVFFRELTVVISTLAADRLRNSNG